MPLSGPYLISPLTSRYVFFHKTVSHRALSLFPLPLRLRPPSDFPSEVSVSLRLLDPSLFSPAKAAPL